MTDRNELERLLAAATEGPWRHTDDAIGDVFISGPDGEYVFEIGCVDDPKSLNDAALICFLRNNAQHYLSLMDEAEKLREALAFVSAKSADELLAIKEGCESLKTLGETK